MADIRINSLPTTASASSSDDFLALDGATNGTRKLNAYSPTFGGNVTASGNLTVSGGTITGANTAYIALTNNNTYSAGAAGGGHTFVGTGNSSFGGNLTVSGTQIQMGGVNPFIQGTTGAGYIQFQNAGDVVVASNTGKLVLIANGSTRATVATTGNFLIGTTIDGGQKLQVNGTIRSGSGSGETLSSGSIDVGADIGIASTQGIVQGGARIVTFTSGNATFAGNVGIGTTSPQYSLQVSSQNTANYYPLTLSSGVIGTIGNTVGMIFGFTGNTYQKGAIIYESTSSNGVGKLHFALNAVENSSNVTLSDSKFVLTSSGDAKFAGSVYAEKSGAGIAGQSTGSITQFTTVNSTTYSVTTAAAKVFVVQLGSGDAALCYASYKSSTITILGSDGTIVNSSSPTSTQLGIYKSANDHVISFKTGSNALAGAYGSWGFCFLGNPVISIA